MEKKFCLFCSQRCYGLLEIRVNLLLENHFVGISERKNISFTTHENLPGMKHSNISSRVCQLNQIIWFNNSILL